MAYEEKLESNETLGEKKRFFVHPSVPGAYDGRITERKGTGTTKFGYSTPIFAKKADYSHKILKLSLKPIRNIGYKVSLPSIPHKSPPWNWDYDF